MVHKMTSPLPQHVRVIFELPASTWAVSAAVVGDFNQWSSVATPFKQDRSGTWRASVDLPDGERHEFLYLLDGVSYTDFHTDGWSTNRHGQDNCVVIAKR